MVVEYVVTSLIMSVINSVAAHNLEGFVVGGDLAKMQDFPHAALLSIECSEAGKSTGIYSCGSSILNQAIVITAAHCLEDCMPKSSSVIVYVGNREKMKGDTYRASSFLMHEEYDSRTIDNDIALVRLKKKLKYGKNVRRVALVRKPPYEKPAKIAGWGYINEDKQISAKYLMQISQRIWKRMACINEMGWRMPLGTICGGEVESPGYAAPGDSGSALVVQNFIQIGIVSYKNAQFSKSLVVYTEIAYFYDWIKRNARSIYCKY